ncbi:ABC transporter ATP-binding protein [Exiguobacterium sp. RIT452]|nr:ABC transporter ATP-binding protein [Exiguobacterium sp. RIT452]
MNMIQLHHVTVTAPTKPLLHAITVDFPANQFICLIGASGSGKTLLLKHLLGLVPETLSVGGTVTFAEGEDWVRGREIGYIPQHYQQSFVPFLTIKETMRDLCRAHHVAYDKEQTESLLRSFRLDIDLLDRLPHQLSGGQLQRMAIILAVFLKPRLILADELTTALDPVATRQLLDWLRNYQQQTAATVLFVTHELTHALHYADTLYIMKEGTIIDAVTPETIHASRHPYTQALYTNRHL